MDMIGTVLTVTDKVVIGICFIPFILAMLWMGIRDTLCCFFPHKWVHVTDYISGKNEFGQDITAGLYRCKWCSKLSYGACGNSVKGDSE